MLRYPLTDRSAIAYARELTELHGVKYVPVRLPAGNRYRLTHAAVLETELAQYITIGDVTPIVEKVAN